MLADEPVTDLRMNFYLVPVEQGRRIVLDKAIIFVGRHPECDVVLTRSRKISRRHCCFAHVNDGVLVRDLGSMNGVRINGRRVPKEAPIAVGDQVAIADLAYVLKAKMTADDERRDRSTKPKPKPKEVPAKVVEPAPETIESDDDPLLSQEIPMAISDDLEEFEMVPIDDDHLSDSFEGDDVLLLEDPSET